jgi:dienelactone hydrolase
MVKVELIRYAAGRLACRGELIYDDSARSKRPLLLLAPNWRGLTEGCSGIGQSLADHGYVVFVADMYGEGNGPKGTEDPMAFLAPIMADVPGMRRNIMGALDTMTAEAHRRGIGDVTRRAAIGYCFGGSNVLDLARAGADVAAVVSVHGVLATSLPANKGDIKAAVLVLHGAADPISPKAHRDAFEAEMDRAGARWYALTFGNLLHAYSDVGLDIPGVAKYDEPATRHGYTLAHAFIDDAFAGRI